MDNMPLVSVIVVNHSSGRYISRCLSSVLDSDYSKIELTVVDNGSTDGSIELVEKLYGKDTRVKIIRNKTNLGPAVGRNIGASLAKGKYLVFLDDDTEVESQWLTEAIKTMDSDSTIGGAQCKLLLMGKRDQFDYAGDYLSRYGFLVQRVDFGTTDEGQLDRVAEIFSAKSAGMIVQRHAFEDIKGFDEDYFIYMEETDLCWRIWLNGYKVVFLPTSVVYHDFGRALKLSSKRTKFLAKYHGTKNYITTLLKNLECRNLLKILPIHVSLWVGILLWHVIGGRLSEANHIKRGILYNLIGLRHVWAKREAIQSSRKVPDRQIMPRIMKSKPLTYFYRKLTYSGSGWRA